MYTVILGFHSLLMEIPGAFVGRAARPFVEAPLVLAQTFARQAQMQDPAPVAI